MSEQTTAVECKRSHPYPVCNSIESKQARFEALVHTLSTDLYRYAFWLCRDQHRAEDLVQETFLRAFRRIETFKGASSFRTWLMTIGSNILKDAWRRRARRPVVALEDREIVDQASDPQSEAVAEDLAARLGACVRNLPRLQRDVFLLRAQQGMQYEEIAGALGTTPGAARVHYHHAIKRLKARLKALR